MTNGLIVATLIERQTGVAVDGCEVWEEMEHAAIEQLPDGGTAWVTGQDDPLCRWQYFVKVFYHCRFLLGGQHRP